MSHRHWKTGAPCNCTFGPKATLARVASKLDWLRSRPDLQTPEGQQWLDWLDQTYGDTHDPLYPWLTREWKRGRLTHRPDSYYFQVDHPTAPQGSVGHHAYAVSPGMVSHWRDWYNSSHPQGRVGLGLDIGSKQFQMPHMFDHVERWDNAMQEDAQRAQLQEQADAPVLHQWPDGWKLQRLLPKHLDYEGDTMGHCVGGYGYENSVRDGNTAIASLRDPEGRPHVTAELEPTGNEADVPHHFDLESAMQSNPVLRATPEWLHEHLRSIHDELGHLDEMGIMRHVNQLAAQRPGQEFDIQPYELYNKLRREHGIYMPSLDKAKIVQIQGKGNEVPKPEYQQRMKDWFQTFPEAQRPNWDYRDKPITHIGGLVPDARTWAWGGQHGRYHKELEGEPDLHDEDEWAEGGYGPHGDYGLVDPRRPIDYLETAKSLVRPQSGPDLEYNWNSYEPAETKVLYQEALRRGELDKLHAALEPLDEHAMEKFDEADQQEAMYNPEHTAYPGESWDEEPERWEGEYDDNGEPLDPQLAWQRAYERYQESQNELSKYQPHQRAANDLYRWMEPHMDRGGSYVPPQPGVAYTDPATRAELGGYHPNNEGVSVGQLPHLAEYLDEDGLGRVVDKQAALPDGQYLGYKPPYIKHPQTPGTFSKAARAAHPHITTGRPCTCPWGAQRLSRTASKMEWLVEGGGAGKFGQTELGQATLKALENLTRMNPKIDPLAPWLLREAKKRRLEPLAWGFTTPEGVSLAQRDLDQWADWFDSNSPTRRGVDVMQLKVDDMFGKISDWEQEKQEAENREKMRKGTVVHDFGDGWTVRRVDDREQASDEGEQMGHCVGGHGHSIENGQTGIFSLRDERNRPHATIEIHPDEQDSRDANGLVHPSGRIHQIQGKSNDEPLPEYKDRLADWFRQAPVWAGRTIDVPAPTNIDELRYWHEPGFDDENQDDPYQLSPYQARDYGLDWTGDYNVEGGPNWDRIIQENLDASGNDHWRDPVEQAEEIRHIAYDTNSQDAYEEALNGHHEQLNKDFYRDHYDPKEYEGPAQVQWNNWDWGQRMKALSGEKRGLLYGPDGQPLDQPTVHQLHPNQEKLFDNLGYDYGYGYPQYQGSPTQPLTYAKVAGISDPLYYRWVFSPTSGEVNLSHNYEDDPKLHGDLAREQNEPGLVHGYAYRIGGGWRLMDWENRPLEDPFVIAQVMRKLRDQENYTPSDEEWEGVVDDYDRQHNGIPLALPDA